MLRLEIAERELRSFLNDRLTNRGCRPEEVNALAKLRDAMRLISDAKFALAKEDTRQPWPVSVAAAYYSRG